MTKIRKEKEKRNLHILLPGLQPSICFDKTDFDRQCEADCLHAAFLCIANVSFERPLNYINSTGPYEVIDMILLVVYSLISVPGILHEDSCIFEKRQAR